LKPDAKVFDMRATFHYVEKNYAKARDDFQAALKLSPNELNTLNNLAWMEATCPDAEYRDGKAAVERATKVCQLSGWRLKEYASTLAAAYAENGDFDKAIAIAEKYEDERLEQYRQRKPVRE
jgi:tetratricopeptide (TPR) repeat protein